MLTHDCGSCVKERAVSVSLHARKLVARSERWREVGHTWKGGLESVVYSESLRHRRHEFFTHGYPRSALPPLSHPLTTVSKPSVSRNGWCVWQKLASSTPSPHPAKRRFRIFRTATRSGGMLILSVDRPPPLPSYERIFSNHVERVVRRTRVEGGGEGFRTRFRRFGFFFFF